MAEAAASGWGCVWSCVVYAGEDEWGRGALSPGQQDRPEKPRNKKQEMIWGAEEGGTVDHLEWSYAHGGQGHCRWSPRGKLPKVPQKFPNRERSQASGPRTRERTRLPRSHSTEDFPHFFLVLPFPLASPRENGTSRRQAREAVTKNTEASHSPLSPYELLTRNRPCWGKREDTDGIPSLNFEDQGMNIVITWLISCLWLNTNWALLPTTKEKSLQSLEASIKGQRWISPLIHLKGQLETKIKLRVK